MNEITVVQPPPAAICARTPDRAKVPLVVTVRIYVCVAVAKELSVTRTAKVETPVVVGVPVTAPDADSVSPAGRVPEMIDQVYGELPPVAVRVCEYPRAVAAGKSGEVVVMVSPALPPEVIVSVKV